MKMKLAYLFVALLTFLVYSTTVKAQTATKTSDLKQKQNAVSQTKDQIQAARDQFKERLQTIKDTRKRDVTARLDSNIALANKKHTDRFREVLTKLQTLLDKIGSEATDAKTILLVKDAQAKIDLAKDAVLSLAAKVHTIEITTEARLRTNAGTAISQFRSDLKQTYNLVIDAKQAVMNLKSINVMMRKEATDSASQ